MKKITAAMLTDNGVCPTCYDKEHDNILFGDKTDRMLYENDSFECFLISNPRSCGHTIISSKKHYKDMMEIPDNLCEEIFVFAKLLMNVLKKVYRAESVYLCTMCDGPMNHFHIQLIPRYHFEKRGSSNFVKERLEYVDDGDKVRAIRILLNSE